MSWTIVSRPSSCQEPLPKGGRWWVINGGSYLRPLRMPLSPSTGQAKLFQARCWNLRDLLILLGKRKVQKGGHVLYPSPQARLVEKEATW